MKKFIAIASICLASVSAFADTKPSDASLDELLTITDSKALVDGMWPQVEAMMNNSAKQALGGATLNSDQQEVMREANAKLAAIFKEEFSYDKMKPMMISIYKESFSQDEVDGMIRFYKSKAGQAVTKKMPAVMQATMANVQSQMSVVLPKIQQVQMEAVEKIKAKAAAAPAK